MYFFKGRVFWRIHHGRPRKVQRKYPTKHWSKWILKYPIFVLLHWVLLSWGWTGNRVSLHIFYETVSLIFKLSYSENSNASKSSDSFQSCNTDERRVKVKEAAPGYVMKNEGSKKGKQHSVGRVRETCSREQVRTSGGCKTRVNPPQQNNEPWDTTTPSSQEDE